MKKTSWWNNSSQSHPCCLSIQRVFSHQFRDNSYILRCGGSKVNLTVGSIDINLTATLWCMLFLSPCQQQVWPLIFISVDKVVHTTDCGTDHITVSQYLQGWENTIWKTHSAVCLTHPWQEKWTTVPRSDCNCQENADHWTTCSIWACYI